MSSEKTLIRCRDLLIENKLFEYKKGTKSKPNKYKISTVNFTVKTTVNTTVDMTVNMGVDVSNINRLDKDIYFTLFNKYKKQIEEKPSQVVQIISTMKKTSDYELLTTEEQDKLFYDLMNPKREWITNENAKRKNNRAY